MRGTAGREPCALYFSHFLNTDPYTDLGQCYGRMVKLTRLEAASGLLRYMLKGDCTFILPTKFCRYIPILLSCCCGIVSAFEGVCSVETVQADVMGTQ